LLPNIIIVVIVIVIFNMLMPNVYKLNVDLGHAASIIEEDEDDPRMGGQWRETPR
jgi:hypothetical protein